MVQPIFNIIYIPGTVDYQTPALISLLLNTDYSFRLVGNALKIKEANLLSEIAQCSNRLSYLNFESDEIIPHGTLLDILFFSEKHKLFCFCDSDLFLFKPINKTPKQLIGNNDVFSSGGRIENDNQAQYAGFRGGATTISPDGKIPLAMSFFSIYKRKPLRKIIKKYKVGFEQYRSNIQIPNDVLSYLNSQQLSFDMFDTGKLLSVLFYKEGLLNSYAPFKNMIHLGGMSGRYLQNIDLQEIQEITDKQLNQSDKVSEQGLHFRNENEVTLKRLYGKYFYIFLNHLIGKSKEPELKIKPGNVKSTIIELQLQIKQLFNIAKNNTTTYKILKLIINSKYE